ncbi:hypothetical protein TNCV_4127601 [Trichonephila clavipes]|uniref:Uncharacterized protein n=1 Tax=Trichonephila clavipes TaxID=2585209 RepID=A0A8X6VRE2_TRICX|nr:hypothetical protein TNCV_4127601 [Trichonephila clavipes]
MPRGRHRASFDQVSELDRGRIVAYRDCGLPFGEISQRVGLNCFLGLLTRFQDLWQIESMWSMLVQRLARDTPATATPDQLWQYMESAWTVVPQLYTQSLFHSMLRRVAVIIANNGGYTNY